MKSKIYHYLCIIAMFVIILPSCMTSEETNYFQTLNIPYPKKQYKEYRLNVNDQVQCAIYSKNKEFSQVFNRVIGIDENVRNEYLIHHNGSILLPYFGEINIAGLTLEEAENHIQAKMQESITDAQVTLNLVNNFFYVLSDRGGRRGQFQIYKENMTIYQALAQMGPAVRDLDNQNIKIIRRDAEGNTYTKSFDIRTNDIIQSEFYYVHPNDMYYFATNKNTFFNVTSLSSFVTTILTPITLLIAVSRF